MDIIERLIDSEEHACECAVPQVAFDAADEIERLRHNLQVTEQTRQEFEELAKLRLEEIGRLRFALADVEALELGTAERCESLAKQLAANNPLLDEAADKIDELEAKLKFAETTLEEIRNEDANKTINYYCDETLAVLRGK